MTDPKYYINLNPIGKRIFDFKLSFVVQRLSVLEDKLFEEECKNHLTQIKLVMEGETVNDFVLVRNYSQEITSKIQDCLKTETAYFEEKIYEIVNSQFN